MQICPLRGSARGTSRVPPRSTGGCTCDQAGNKAMHEIIYLIGLVVVVMFVLGLLGVR
jgi:hypothetical protein